LGALTDSPGKEWTLGFPVKVGLFDYGAFWRIIPFKKRTGSDEMLLIAHINMAIFTIVSQTRIAFLESFHCEDDFERE
jgi:hypothetical protein